MIAVPMIFTHLLKHMLHLDSIPKGYQLMIMKHKGFRITYGRVHLLSLPTVRHSVTLAEHLLCARHWKMHECARSPSWLLYCAVGNSWAEVNATQGLRWSQGWRRKGNYGGGWPRKAGWGRFLPRKGGPHRTPRERAKRGSRASNRNVLLKSKKKKKKKA